MRVLSHALGIFIGLGISFVTMDVANHTVDSITWSVTYAGISCIIILYMGAMIYRAKGLF